MGYAARESISILAGYELVRFPFLQVIEYEKIPFLIFEDYLM